MTLQYMQNGKLSLMRLVVIYVSPTAWMPLTVTFQVTEANVSCSRHAYDLTDGCNKHDGKSLAIRST